MSCFPASGAFLNCNVAYGVGLSLVAIVRLERRMKRVKAQQKARDEHYQREIDYLNENIDQLYQVLKERSTLFRIHDN